MAPLFGLLPALLVFAWVVSDVRPRLTRVFSTADSRRSTSRFIAPFRPLVKINRFRESPTQTFVSDQTGSV